MLKIESGSIPVLIFLLVIAYGGLVAALLPLILAFWTVVMSFTALHITAINYNVTLYVSWLWNVNYLRYSLVSNVCVVSYHSLSICLSIYV